MNVTSATFHTNSQPIDYNAVPTDDASYELGSRTQAGNGNDETAYLGNGSALLEPKNSHDHDGDEGRLDSRIMLSLGALAFTYVGSQITQFFIATSGLFIAKELDISSQYSWLGVGINLGYVSAAPSAGYLQDMFGRRNALIIGSLFDILGNVVIATSHGFPQIVTGSIIAGIGSAITELTTTAAMAEIVPVRLRGVVLALNTGLLLFFTPSLLYSELISTHSSWRWCFYICLIWTVVAFVLLLATYVRLNPQRPISPGSKRAAARSIDYVGIALLTAGFILLLVGLQSGGNDKPWTSTTVLCELIIGCVFLLLVPLWEYFFATNPIIPLRLFRGQRIIFSLFIITFVAEMNYSTSLNLGPVVLKEVFDPQPVIMGLWGLPPGIGLALGAILFNVLITVLRGRARELLTVAAVLMTAFVAAQAAVSPSNPAFLVAMTGVSAFGVGGIDMPAITVVTAACPADLIGTAIALLTTVRTIGGALGYAIFYNIFYSNAKEKVPELIGEYAVKAGLPKSEVKKFAELFYNNAIEAATLPNVNGTILKAAAEGQKWAIAESVRLVYYASIPFGVLAILLCVSLPSISKLMTGRVLVKHG